MKIIDPQDETQAFIDSVVEEAQQQSQILNEAQKQRLITLADKYRHLGSVAVTLVYEAIMDAPELSQATTQHMQQTLEKQAFPERFEEQEEELEVIEGEATPVEVVEET